MFLMDLKLSLLFAFIGCGICERACSDYEGFISTSHRPGQQIPSFCELTTFFIATHLFLTIDVLHL